MPGQEIFRFVQLTAPRKRGSTLNHRLRLTPFSRSIIDARNRDDNPSTIFELADEFLESERFNRDPSTLEFNSEASDFLDALRERSVQSLSDYEDLIDEMFGEDPSSLVEEDAFERFMNAVSDGVIAMKLSSEKYPRQLSEYITLQRAVSIIERVADEDPQLEESKSRVLSRATVALPEEIFPLPSKTVELTDQAPPDDQQQQIDELSTKIDNLDRAMDEMLSLGAQDLEVIEVDTDTNDTDNSDIPESNSSARFSNVTASSLTTDILDISPRSFAVFKESSIKTLSENTRATLSSLHVDLRENSLRPALDTLENESFRLQKELNRITTPGDSPRFMRIGSTTIPVNLPAFPQSDVLAQPEDPGIPTTVGNIKPSHVGKLLKARQHIIRYAAEEIAHVENVVIGESKNRETRRLRRTEETFTREEETTREEERDLQTTERMELQREVQNTIKENQQFKIGASISAEYGPVKVSVNTEFSTESSSESTNRTASSYAREITEKTASRITERIREEQTIRTIQEFEETNQHGFANNTEEHISAMFQWLTKVYRAQLYDYGVRLFFNVTVPEPQYFLLNTLAKQKAPAEGLTAPEPINFKPGDITPSNYQKYVKKYQAEGIKPPPKPKIIISKTFRFPETMAPLDDPPPEEMTNSLEIPIDDGYKAVEAYVIFIRGRAKHGATQGLPTDILTGLTVFIGKGDFYLLWDQTPPAKAGGYVKPLGNEVGSIAVGLHARNIESYVLGIEITTARTSRAIAEWQHETYDTLVARYQTLEAEYRDRKAELETQEGIKIEGRNPLENRLLERNELKRSSLSMLTGQYFEKFDAILGFSEGRIDFDEATPEGRYARFFENAFEWENMVYQFYPYFYGRKSTWQKKLLLRDVDPIHAEFLKCGYADIQLPVRPDFEAALMHYLDTGKVWHGAEPPDITDSRYIDFLEEIKERRDEEEPHQEIPFEGPWDIHLPTTLVRIRPGNSLPEWEQDEESGEWLPVGEDI